MWAFPERFEGRHVRLEPLALAHLPAFLRHYDPEVYRFLSRAPVAPTEEALRAHLEGLLGEPGRVNWAILFGKEVAGRISVIAPEPFTSYFPGGLLSSWPLRAWATRWMWMP